MISKIIAFFLRLFKKPEPKRERERFELVLHPDERLRAKCLPVETFDKDFENLVADMAHFMFTGLPWGRPAGLAAPQVGKNIRMFLVNEGLDKGRESANFRCIVNPVIVWETKAPADFCQEGCFSLERDKMDYPVRRKSSIKVRYQDLEGTWLEDRFNGKQAYVIQHELDHLDGILICDKE